MAITRLNHAVLFVRDVAASVAFYTEVLGFKVVNKIPAANAAFLQAADSNNDHDLGLFEIGSHAADSAAGGATVGLYHLAWEVDTLAELSRVSDALLSRGALVGSTDHSTTKSLYGKDPDGLEFEIAWVVPATFIDDEMLAQRSALKPLDLQRELDRFGPETLGGVGVSHTGTA